MIKRFQRQEGFSLVELLIAVAVLGLLMAGAFGVLFTSIKSFQNTADQGANIQLSRGIVNAISDEIRNATAIQTPAFVSGTAQTSQVLEYTYTNNIDGSVTSRQITLSSNNILIKNITAGTTKTLGQGRVKAASLNFVRDKDDQRIFTVNFTLQSNSYAGSIDTPISTVVTTMNSGT